MDETDVDSYLHHNIFDTAQTQHRKVRVSKCSNNKPFAFKLFQSCAIKTQQRYKLQEQVNISQRELMTLVDSLRHFHKHFDKAAENLQIPFRNPKFKLDLRSQKTISAHYYNDIVEHPKRQIRLLFRFGNNIS